MSSGSRAAALIGLFVLLWTPAVAQGGAGNDSEVRIEVFVHNDEGDPIQLRDPRPLRLFVDGTPTDFDWTPDEPLAVAAVLDLSSSVSGDRLDAVIGGFRSFLSGLGDDDRCAVLSFTRSVVLHAGWDESCAEAAEGLGALVSGGPSAHNSGVMLALGLLADAPGRPVLALFSDGEDGASWAADGWPLIATSGIAPMVLAVTAPAVTRSQGRLRGAYARMDAQEDIAVRWRYEGRFVQIENWDLGGMRSVDPFQVLEDLATSTGGGVIRADGSPESIEREIASLGAAIEDRLSLRYRPPRGFTAGTHEIRVESDVGNTVHRTQLLWPEAPGDGGVGGGES